MRSIRFVPSLLYALVVLTLVTLATPAPSFGQFFVSITVAPPALPVYEQPPIPAPGYMWTPGYWAWSPDDQDYYWVPGTWVSAPQVGYLWTPGYWGWSGGAFMWNQGYWGPHIGFYGGVNYGFGYGGAGYEGGYWNNGAFYYNRSVTNVTNVTNITNVYNKTVVNNVTVNNVSYNGGAGGVTAQPTTAERAAASEHHIAPTTEQVQHLHLASTNPALKASVNHGKPVIAATSKPGVFSGHGVVGAKAATPYHPVPVKGATGRSTTPTGGGNHPTYNERPESKTQETVHPLKNEPPSHTMEMKSEPRSHVPEPKIESHPVAAPPKAVPPPRSEPAPKGKPEKPPKQ